MVDLGLMLGMAIETQDIEIKEHKPLIGENGDRARLTQKRLWRVVIVGAGYIAETHAAVLRQLENAEITAVVDIDTQRADAFAARWDIRNVATSVDELIGRQPKVDVAHVLVPPQFHMPVASRLLAAGIHALIEKPLAQSRGEAEAITAAATQGPARFAVNHNFIHHPAHKRAQELVAARKFGRLRHVNMEFNMPLQQLATRQFGHWMFNHPCNLLLEQAIHPLSLIDSLIGATAASTCITTPAEKVAGLELIRSFLIALCSATATAQLHFSVGESYPVWRALLICDDGTISIDYLANQAHTQETRRWLPAFSSLHNTLAESGAILRNELRNVTGYVGSTLKLWPRTDYFFVSMTNSIRQFYYSLADPPGKPGDEQAIRLIDLCSDLAAGLENENLRTFRSKSKAEREGEIVIIGGTGFLGQHVIRALIGGGKPVSVMARNIERLPAIFEDPRVTLIRGDVTNYKDVRAAIANVKAVVNLAHGGGSTPDESFCNLVSSARTVAEACLAAETKRLIFVSSIAALYLGDHDSVITGITPPDLRSADRDAYSHGKAEAERLLHEMHRERGLPVCILRPGVVTGEGGLPFHSGAGNFVNERHCMGWNEGQNALPFVLASDIADAIVRSLDAPNVSGRCYNLVGGVPITAREYVSELARVLDRPLRFHPQSVYKIFVAEMAKYLIKRLIGRSDQRPTLRDLRSRGLVARFDCRDAIEDLGWHPVSDRAEFLRAGIQVYGH